MRNIFAVLFVVAATSAASASDIGDCRPIVTANGDGTYTSVLPTTCKWTTQKVNPQDDATFSSAGEGEGGGSAE